MLYNIYNFDKFRLVFIHNPGSEVNNLTLNTFLCIFSAILFAVSSLLFISQAIYSLDFRKKIALTHNFSEAVMSGPYYPLSIIFFSIIFIQFISFLAFEFTTEINIIIRMFAYISSIILFIFFRYKTPPLLSYWLSQTCLWRKAGFSGKIPYSEIIGIKIARNVQFPITYTQKLCKVTFFIDPDFSGCKKITCKITARDLEFLSKQIDVFPPEYDLSAVSKVKLFSSFLIPILLFIIYILAFLISAASGIFNPYRYVNTNNVINEEIKTVTSVSDVGRYKNTVCVYYRQIGVINVYDSHGTFQYAINCPSSFLKPSDFSVTDDGCINYRLAEKLYRYSSVDGTLISTSQFSENDRPLLRVKTDTVKFDYSKIYISDENLNFIPIITRPATIAIFNVEVIWSGLAILIAVSFTMRFLTLRKKKSTHSIHKINI